MGEDARVSGLLSVRGKGVAPADGGSRVVLAMDVVVVHSVAGIVGRGLLVDGSRRRLGLGLDDHRLGRLDVHDRGGRLGLRLVRVGVVVDVGAGAEHLGRVGSLGGQLTLGDGDIARLLDPRGLDMTLLDLLLNGRGSSQDGAGNGEEE